jgi:ubiquitin-protein ligase
VPVPAVGVVKHAADLPLVVCFARWRPALTIKQLLLGIQTLLNEPNPADAAQEEPCRIYITNPSLYEIKVKQQSRLFLNSEDAIAKAAASTLT